MPSGYFYMNTRPNLTFPGSGSHGRLFKVGDQSRKGADFPPLSFLLHVLVSTLTLWSRFSAHYPVSLGKVERRCNGTLSCYTPGQKWKCLGHEIHLRLFSAHFPCLESVVWEMSCGMIFKLHTCWSVSPRRSRRLVLVGFYLISAFLAGLSTTQTEGCDCLSSINFSSNRNTHSLPLP